MTDIKSYKEKYGHTENYGKGGQATTQIGYDRQHGNAEQVLIKILNRQKDLERRKRMHREYTTLKTLQHNLIPKVYDSNTEHHEDTSYNLYIAMEFVHGATLKAYIEQHGPLGLEDAVVFCVQLLDAVDFCHNNGIIHRDIKPDNIVLRSDNLSTPVLIDFGLSFNQEENNSILTPESQILGNRFLFLPELGKNSGNKNDIRSDITMVIGVLFYVLTGNEPGHLIDEQNRLPHQRERIVITEEVKPNVAKMSHIFDTGFQHNISHRFQNIYTLKTELELVLAPIAKPQNTGARLSAYLEKTLNAHNLEKRINERMMSAIESNLNELFFRMRTKFKETVELAYIQRYSGESSCWCAYSVQECQPPKRMTCIKLEASLLGDQVIFSGGVIALHGQYTGQKQQICRISKSEIKHVDYDLIHEFLIIHILNYFESYSGHMH